MYIRPGEHLFAILENSTLRRDWNLPWRQISLYFHELFNMCLPDLFIWRLVSPVIDVVKSAC